MFFISVGIEPDNEFEPNKRSFVNSVCRPNLKEAGVCDDDRCGSWIVVQQPATNA